MKLTYFCILACFYGIWGEISAQNFDLRRDWEPGWFNNPLNMPYGNTPTGVNNNACPTGIASLQRGPLAAAGASGFFAITEGGGVNRWNYGGSPATMPLNSIQTMIFNNLGSGASELAAVPAAGKYYTTKIRGLGFVNTTAIVMETDNAPIEFTHVSAVDNLVLGTLSAAPSPQEKIYVLYRTAGSGGAFTALQATLNSNAPGNTTNIPALSFTATIPLADYEFFVISSTALIADINADYELCTLRDYGTDTNGQNTLSGSNNQSGAANCPKMQNFHKRTTFNGMCMPEGGATVALDGNIDAQYGKVLESMFASPAEGGSSTTSDFEGESSALVVYYDAGFNYSSFDNISGRGWGNADIRNFYLAWDNTYLYMLVEGPNAYHPDSDLAGDNVDRMDLFIAIDTDDDIAPSIYSSGKILPASQAPYNKRVDFNGWTPDFFVAVERFGGAGGSYASLHAAGATVGTVIEDDNNTTTQDACPSFEFSGNFSTGVTEVRVPWSRIGGRPDIYTGKKMNFAVYTTFDEDNYDIYDSGPGLGSGHGKPFEQVGDCPWDADHAGGHRDPVTGVADGTFLYGEALNGDPFDSRVRDQGPGDNDRAANNGRQPASDRTQSNGADNADFDTIEEYWSILNVGQLSSKVVCLAAPANQSITCLTSLPTALTGTYTEVLTNVNPIINASNYVMGGGSVTITDPAGCYIEGITVTASDVESGIPFTAADCATCAGVFPTVTRTYTIQDNSLITTAVACGANTTGTSSNTCIQTITRTLPLPAECVILPLEWLQLEAYYWDNAVQLEWETAHEKEVEKFIIERSHNKTYFSPIGEVQSKGKTSAIYNFQDYFLPATSSLYYRIKQIDIDGNFSYSSIVETQLPQATQSFYLAPNPTEGSFSILYESLENEVKAINLYNNIGQKIMSLPLQGNRLSLPIDLSIYPKGMYFVELETTQFTDRQKIILQ